MCLHRHERLGAGEETMIEKLSESSGNVIGYKTVGKLVAADYDMIVPEVEALVKQEGNIRMLMDLDEFHGATIKAEWSDLKFGREFRKNIDKMAIVGDKSWEKWVTSLVKPLSYAREAKYFHIADIGAAWAWLRED